MVRGSIGRFASSSGTSGGSAAAARTRTYIVAAAAVVLATLVVLHAVGSSAFWNLARGGGGGASRKVEKHFFFELLPSFDLDESGHRGPPTAAGGTVPSALGPSLFAGIMDRVLFTRYLVERFAFASFVQLGCAGSSHVYQLLPDTAVPTRLCVDAGESVQVAERRRELRLSTPRALTTTAATPPPCTPFRPRVGADPVIRLPQRLRRRAGTPPTPCTSPIVPQPSPLPLSHCKVHLPPPRHPCISSISP